VIADSSIQVDAFLPESRAELFFTPLSTGSTTLTLMIQDDGGTEYNNGNASAVFTFELIVASKPATGHTARMSDFKNWGIDKLGEQQTAELGSFHGKKNVLKIELHEKTCWTGSMYFTPELNVDQHRYLCYDIYFEGGDFTVPPPGRGQGLTHCYFWDEGWNGNLDRNVDATHAQRKRVYEGEWQTVLMDFRGPGGMNNSENTEINTHRIQKILFNYATNFNWPNPSDNGTVYLANIRIGSHVPDSLLPEIKPVCTIDPVADQVYFTNPGEQEIQLCGITSGLSNSHTPVLAAISSDTTILPHPRIADFQGEKALLFVHPMADTTGTAQVTITVSAQEAKSKSTSFSVELIKQDRPVLIELARDTLFQEIKGFGTFQFEKRRHYIDLYTEDLGASAIRTGIISNQIEWMNDNSDPDILDLQAFDSNAFDFSYYRELKQKGIETFILTSWSPPAWMKRNLSVAYGHASAPEYHRTDNILEPYYYNEFAESMVAAVKLFRIHAGIDLYALGPQNEPAFCEPYASAVLSPDKFAVLLEIIGSRFESEGINTRLYMPEQVFTQNHYSMSQYISAVKSRPIADQYTDIIATHGYGTSGVNAEQPNYSGWSQMWQQAQSCQTPKELWMTETFPKYTDWKSALSLAAAIHGALVWGNVGLWTLWDIEETLIIKGQPTASFYTSKNYYKYIRPGARRIRAIHEDSDILACAFVHPETKQQTLVLINKGASTKNILLSGDRHADEYEVYTTARHMNFEFKGYGVKGGQVLLPASSVTTLVGELDEPILVNVEERESLPETFQLYQNYPNPFNPVTTLRFSIPKTTQISLVIYNMLGQRVRTLVNHSMAAGQHQIFWDGTNDSGRQVSTGVYFYRIVAGEFIATKKCVLLR
jgi:O-glycosyl hydrolase